MIGLNRHFSHIYVERKAFDCSGTRTILAKFSQATVVEIDDYKEVFNRPAQSWKVQKRSMNLILARKKDDFLYPASPIAPSFGFKHFYYNALALNCMYDCHYCYLQGMYGSANPVFFVNLEEYFEASDRELEKHSPMYLCISYDTDLLAFEDLLGYCRRWIDFAASRSNLFVELRTKSAGFKSIADLTPVENVVLAWTFSPQEIAEKYEAKTPSLTARLRSARAACEAGWPVRVCFDPILHHPDWRQIYDRMVETVFHELPAEKIRDVSLGVFRMNGDFYRKVRQKRVDSDLVYQGFEKRGGLTTYPEEIARQLVASVKSKTCEFVDPEKVLVVDPF